MHRSRTASSHGKRRAATPTPQLMAVPGDLGRACSSRCAPKRELLAVANAIRRWKGTRHDLLINLRLPLVCSVSSASLPPTPPNLDRSPKRNGAHAPMASSFAQQLGGYPGGTAGRPLRDDSSSQSSSTAGPAEVHTAMSLAPD